MMGTKIRNFAPLPGLSFEELVPQDNFYRRRGGAIRGCVPPCAARREPETSC